MIRLFSLVLLLAMIQCKSANHKSAFTPDFQSPGPVAWVFKLSGDFSDKVPVTMNEDQTEIVAYPSIEGIMQKKPTPLGNGYFMDNGLINPNVVFINMKIEEYAALKTAPSLATMQELIISKQPFERICNCGNKAAIYEPVKTLTTMVKSGELEKKCKKIK